MYFKENNICERHELNEAVTEWNNELSDQMSKIDSHVPKVIFYMKYHLTF